jgi:hypothetical protein
VSTSSFGLEYRGSTDALRLRLVTVGEVNKLGEGDSKEEPSGGNNDCGRTLGVGCNWGMEVF